MYAVCTNLHWTANPNCSEINFPIHVYTCSSHSRHNNCPSLWLLLPTGSLLPTSFPCSSRFYEQCQIRLGQFLVQWNLDYPIELRLSEHSIISTLCSGPCVYAYINSQPRLSKLSIIWTFFLASASLDNQCCSIHVPTFGTANMKTLLVGQILSHSNICLLHWTIECMI